MALTPITGEIQAQPLNDNFSYLESQKMDNDGFIYNVKNAAYGATGDGVTDDTAAIQAAMATADAAGGGIVFFPVGTYLITSALNVLTHVSLWGSGYSSQIKANAAIPMLSLQWTTASLTGNRYGVIGQLYLNGNNIATYGINAELVVERHFRDIQIMNVNGPGLQIDAGQNSVYESIIIQSCDEGLVLLNGAGNNLFLRCEIAENITEGLLMKQDVTTAGYTRNMFTNEPTGNKFVKCIVELDTANYGVNMLNGWRNVFDTCDFASGTLARVFVDTAPVLNVFKDCAFNGGAIPAIIQKGYRTYLIRPVINGFTAGQEVIQTYAETIIQKPHIGNTTTTRISNKSGDQKANIKLELHETNGTTAERPNYGDMGIIQYYDTTLGKSIWWNGSAWVDATGTGV